MKLFESVALGVLGAFVAGNGGQATHVTKAVDGPVAATGSETARSDFGHGKPRLGFGDS